MSKTSFTDTEYIEVYRPDKAKLAELIKQAKGESRTMAEFAKDCKSVSAATFSRIVNGKITKPLSTELIDIIIENAESPESISRDAFLRANGMMPKSEWEKNSFSGRIEERINTYKAVKHTIADELYARGCMLCVYPGVPWEELPESSLYLRMPLSRLAIRIQGYEPKYWNFLVHIPYPGDYETITDEKARRTYFIRDIMDNWSPIFLRDMWEPDTLRDVKHSFVFTDKWNYDVFSDVMMKIRVNTYMSMILIDAEKNRIVEEKMIPRFDGKTLESIFVTKKPSPYYSYDG